MVEGRRTAAPLRDEAPIAYKVEGIDERLAKALRRVRAVRDAVSQLEVRREARALASDLPAGSALARELTRLARDLPAAAPPSSASAGQPAASGSAEGYGRDLLALIDNRHRVAEARTLRQAAVAVAAEVRKRYPTDGDQVLLSVVDRVDRDLSAAKLSEVPGPRSPLGLLVLGRVVPFVQMEWAAGRIDLEALYADHRDLRSARHPPLDDAGFEAWRKRAEEYQFIPDDRQAAFERDVGSAERVLKEISSDIEQLEKDKVEAAKIKEFREQLAALTTRLKGPREAGRLYARKFNSMEPVLRSLAGEVQRLGLAVASEGRSKRTEWLAAREKDAERLTGPVHAQWDKWIGALAREEGEPLDVTPEQWQRAVARIGALQAALEEVQRLPAYAPPAGSAASSWGARLQGLAGARRDAARDKLLSQVEQARGRIADIPGLVPRIIPAAASGLKDEFVAMGEFAGAADALEKLLGEWYGPDDKEVEKLYAQAKALAPRALGGDAALEQRWQDVAARAELPKGTIDVAAWAGDPPTAARALHHWLLSPAPAIASDQDADALVQVSSALLESIKQHGPAVAQRKQELTDRVLKRCRAAWMDAFVKAADVAAIERLASRADKLHADLDELKKPQHQRLAYNFWVWRLKDAARNHKDQVAAIGQEMKDFVPEDALLRKELERVRKILAQKVDAAAVAKVGPVSKPYDQMKWQDATPAAADGEPPRQIIVRWAGHELRFARVTPESRPGEPEAKAFYLGTTEVPVKLFADAAAALDAAQVPTLVQADVVQDEQKLGFRHWDFAAGIKLRADWGIDSKVAGRTAPVNPQQYWQDAGRGGPPQPTHPMTYLTPRAAQQFAAALGCRLPTAGEWQEAYRSESQPLDARMPNLRDRAWSLHFQRVLDLGKGDLRDMRRGGLDSHRVGVHDDARRPLVWRKDLAGNTAVAAEAYDDGYTWLAEVQPSDRQATFHHLVGNVAEFVADPQAPDKALIIGGSALSMPPTANELAAYPAEGRDAKSRLLLPHAPPPRPVLAYSDVGMRLAFDSPAATLAEARYVLAKAP
jgi:hypothetical protein